MSAFSDKQNALQSSRIALNTIQETLYTQQELLKLQQLKIKYRLEQEALLYLPDTDEDQIRLVALQDDVYEQQLVYEAALKSNAEVETAFHELNDATIMAGNLDDSFPILLMPVRVHTRFVKVKHLAKNMNKESIFDVSQLDAEENIPLLKYQENKALLSFPNYFDYEAAGGGTTPLHFNSYFNIFKRDNIFKNRSWLKVVPDSFELWVRIYPDDIFVHTHEEHLTPLERAEGEAFWRTWWAVHKMNSNALAEEHAAEDLSEKPLFLAWSSLQRKYQHTRAAWIFRETMPTNYRLEENEDKTDYEEAAVFSTENIKIKSEVWTQPILSWVLPDKFVVTLIQDGTSKNFEGKPIPHPLKLSPAPSTDATLDEIKWVEDIEEAEKIGMAIKIPIETNGFKLNKPFEKVVVVGVKTSMTAADGKQSLEKLLENHRYKGKGMAILSQGTPTNNFERVRSGYTAEGLPAEETFRLETGKPLFSDEEDWGNIKDGKYFVKALGLNASIFQHIHKSDSKDIAHAFAMNKLLWSATMGYYLEQFLQPIISKPDIEKTRDFFLNHVTASGQLPVFRINQQPYSVLPISNFSNWTTEGQTTEEDIFLNQLFHKALKPLDNIWRELTSQLKNISDADLRLEERQFSAELVNILGLKASSTAFFQRPQVGRHLLESSQVARLSEKKTNLDDFINVATQKFFKDFLPTSLHFLKLYLGNNYRIGHYHEIKERIFHQYFGNFYREFPNQLIDKITPSEKRKLSKFKIGETEINYLEWLGHSSYQDLMNVHFSKERKEEGQIDTLLYLFARQALARNYIDLAVSLSPDKDKIISTIDFEMEHLSEYSRFSVQNATGIRFEFGAEVNHYLKNVEGIDANDIQSFSYLYSNNKWSYLQKTTEETGDLTIGEHIEEKLSDIDEDIEGKLDKDEYTKYAPLIDAKKALTLLKDTSTASLQRLFSEHLDLCTYRLDAWMLGLVNHRLKKLRALPEKAEGIYLGAYGYVENLSLDGIKEVFKVIENPDLKEENRPFNADQLVLPMIHLKSFEDNGMDTEELLQNTYVYLGQQPTSVFEQAENNPEKIVNQPYLDDANQGFIHTPSQAHAVTAAILRSGFMANQPDQKNREAGKYYDEFAINLSSERVRKALYYIQGMRNGQDLAALLGYQFERALHDNPVPFLDAYLFDFRRAFPLTKKEENENPDEPTETIKPFNVVHGLDLLNFYRAEGENIEAVLNKKGIKLDLEHINEQNLQHAKAQIKKALDHLSHSMDAISDLLVSESIFHTAKGDMTRSGSVLKMLSNDKEIAIPEISQTPQKGQPLSHLVGIQFDLKSTEKIWAGVDSPRSLLNPGLNRWLFEQMPNPSTMCFNISINGVLERLSIRNLLLQPLDLLALFQGKNPLSETSALTYLIREVAIKFFKPELNADIQVLYYDKTGMAKTQKTLAELKPLFENLQKIINNSRPLFPTDLQLSSLSRPLEKAFYETLDHSNLLSVFEKIVNGEEQGSLYRYYNNVRSYTIFFQRIKAEGFPENNQQETYSRLLRLLHDTIYLNQLQEDYNLPAIYSKKNYDIIVEKGERCYKKFEGIFNTAKSKLEAIKTIVDRKKQWESLLELTNLIFGKTLILSPHFHLNNQNEFSNAREFPDLMIDLDETAKIEWLQGLALVRENIKAYKKLEIFRNLFDVQAKSQALDILQLPYQVDTENYRWLGTTFSSQINIKGEQLSIALEYPEDYNTSDLQSGIIIDSWTERIQSETTETAFALHYNQPNAEPPQSCLLCVTPEITGNWKWEDVVGAVLSAMDMAKKRAIEPAHWVEENENRPNNVHYMRGHPLKFILPALSIPVSNTTNTPAMGFDEDNNHF